MRVYQVQAVAMERCVNDLWRELEEGERTLAQFKAAWQNGDMASAATDAVQKCFPGEQQRGAACRLLK